VARETQGNISDANPSAPNPYFLFLQISDCELLFLIGRGFKNGQNRSLRLETVSTKTSRKTGTQPHGLCWASNNAQMSGENSHCFEFFLVLLKHSFKKLEVNLIVEVALQLHEHAACAGIIEPE
jgi:hypothetical protein